MSRSKLMTALAFSMVLAGCGGGGETAANVSTPSTDQQAPNGGNASPGEDSKPAIDLATAPLAEGIDELVPPGVPRLN